MHELVSGTKNVKFVRYLLKTDGYPGIQNPFVPGLVPNEMTLCKNVAEQRMATLVNSERHGTASMAGIILDVSSCEQGASEYMSTSKSEFSCVTHDVEQE